MRERWRTGAGRLAAARPEPGLPGSTRRARCGYGCAGRCPRDDGSAVVRQKADHLDAVQVEDVAPVQSRCRPLVGGVCQREVRRVGAAGVAGAAATDGPGRVGADRFGRR